MWYSSDSALSSQIQSQQGGGTLNEVTTSPFIDDGDYVARQKGTRLNFLTG